MTDRRRTSLTEAFAATEVDERRDLVNRLEQQGVSAAELIAALPALADDRAREAVVQLLGRLGDAEALETLFQILQGCETPSLRTAAAQAAGDIGGSDAGSMLVRILGETESDPELQETILASLGDSGYRPAGEALVPWLFASRPTTRIAAAWALGRLHALPALQPLRLAARLEQNEFVAGRMLEAISELVAPADGLGDSQKISYLLRTIAQQQKWLGRSLRHRLMPRWVADSYLPTLEAHEGQVLSRLRELQNPGVHTPAWSRLFFNVRTPLWSAAAGQLKQFQESVARSSDADALLWPLLRAQALTLGYARLTAAARVDEDEMTRALAVGQWYAEERLNARLEEELVLLA